MDEKTKTRKIYKIIREDTKNNKKTISDKEETKKKNIIKKGVEQQIKGKEIATDDIKENEKSYETYRQILVEASVSGCTRMAKIEYINNSSENHKKTKDSKEIILSRQDNMKLISFIEEFDNEENIQSNIYLAEVIKIDKSNNSLFLTYEQGKICFLNLKELSKKNVSQEEINNISVGTKLVVQMVRERKDHKHPKVTTNIMMYGLYCNILVETPFDVIYQNTSLINTSFYNSIMQHKFLRNHKFYIKQHPSETNQRLLIKDIKSMVKLWQHIKKTAMSKPDIGLLHFEPYIPRMMRTIMDKNVKSVVVAGDKVFQQIRETPFLLNSVQIKNLTCYKGDKGIFNYYNIQEEICKISNLTIQKDCIRINFHKTDALITIDVDYSSKNSKHMTNLLEINKSAASLIIEEVIKKNIGGSLIIDFINMLPNPENHINLVNHIKSELAIHEINCVVYNIKQLGFVFFCLPYNKYDIFNRMYDSCSHCNFGVKEKEISRLYNIIYLIKDFIKTLEPFSYAGAQSDGKKVIFSKSVYNLLYKHSQDLMIDLANTKVQIVIED